MSRTNKHPIEIFIRAFESIRLGGGATLEQPPSYPCADQVHEPFRVRDEPAIFRDSDERLLWGVVRTSGAQFSGDRSDVHDIFSIIWALVIRAFGLGSPVLIDEPHIWVPGELGARHLLFDQCPWNLFGDDNFARARRAMMAWTSFGFHLLDEVFVWHRIHARNFRTEQPLQAPAWTKVAMRNLRHPSDVNLIVRRCPCWVYLSSPSRGITIARMTRHRLTLLKGLLAPFQPSTVEGQKALVLFANGIPNAVSYKTLKRGRQLLAILGEHPDKVLVVPIDSHCIFLGAKSVVAIRDYCGRETFDTEREALLRRRPRENQVFFAYSTVEWILPIHASDFESLCLDLLRREPGVLRAKPVGSTQDRDGGRDILLEIASPTPHTGGDEGSRNTIQSAGTRRMRVIAQIKSRSKTVGKGDILDIRDTTDHHNADGFLAIVYPRLSSSLVDHLEQLRHRTNLLTDWWESLDIEERLRRHPDIANRYPRLIKLRSTMQG
jgi:hypothetical protein